MHGRSGKSEEHPSDAEDPMREAVALRERIEFRWRGGPGTVVAGFRPNGFLSVYFGEEPYYQFDADARLRRARVGDRLFRTEGSGLAALTRVKEPAATVLVRHDLDTGELDAFRRVMRERIRELHEAVTSAQIEILQQVPAEARIVERLARGLEAVLSAAGELAPAINKVR
jgi:hypothetical protein